MIELKACGQPFGESEGIAPPKASPWIMNQYRDYINENMGDGIKEACRLAKECLITKDELVAALIEAMDKQTIPGLSTEDTKTLIIEAVTKEMKL
ncbi:hypothetical protein KA005_50295 [bacterium]|nr:hypothetical protein [bacterium]